MNGAKQSIHVLVDTLNVPLVLDGVIPVETVRFGKINGLNWIYLNGFPVINKPVCT